ncbi:putative quinol monooxygenase [Wielerella bovis]|uniref:putative quinol monooxygenase n=1 Tax=Wielerella bovis TaxID=2917790 RepID=UPI0020188381|nr:putative quinol monooxygenase [Wielerella bovis]ULJ60599.1 antibiotic biosynthesis monooxygenase [Wielerella bovis]
MIGVYATAQVKPECKAEFLALVQAFVEESRTHTGCISYDCGAINGETDQYCFIERWQSQADLDAHMQTDFFTGNAPKLVAMTVNGLAIHTLSLL